MLLVTHKLYNLRQVDHLIVMEEGKIDAQGAYEEVMEDSSIFREMVNAQRVDFVIDQKG